MSGWHGFRTCALVHDFLVHHGYFRQSRFLENPALSDQWTERCRSAAKSTISPSDDSAYVGVNVDKSHLAWLRRAEDENDKYRKTLADKEEAGALMAPEVRSGRLRDDDDAEPRCIGYIRVEVDDAGGSRAEIEVVYEYAEAVATGSAFSFLRSTSKHGFLLPSFTLPVGRLTMDIKSPDGECSSRITVCR